MTVIFMRGVSFMAGRCRIEWLGMIDKARGGSNSGLTLSVSALSSDWQSLFMDSAAEIQHH